MKPRRHVRTFQPRFVPLVESGAKTSTIRRVPAREICVGDVLDLRTWSGAPYRSKQRKLREVICTSVRPIEIITRAGRQCLGGVAVWIFYGDGLDMLTGRRAYSAIAKAEGFPSIGDLALWFLHNHGTQFKGVQIEWKA